LLHLLDRRLNHGQRSLRTLVQDFYQVIGMANEFSASLAQRRQVFVQHNRQTALHLYVADLARAVAPGEVFNFGAVWIEEPVVGKDGVVFDMTRVAGVDAP
jgi:hypothetical protein